MITLHQMQPKQRPRRAKRHRPRVKPTMPGPRVVAILVLLLSQALMAPLWARNDLRFQNLSVEQGLSQNVVLAVFQDSLGFMWFGTQDGLNRYDGYQFRIYRNDPGDPTSISDNWVHCIMQDHQDYLWIGTANGLNRFDPATDTFTHFTAPLATDGSTVNNEVRYITEDSQHRLWMITGGDPLVMDASRQNLTLVVMEPGRPSREVSTLFEDHKGGIWFGFQSGDIARLAPSGTLPLIDIPWRPKQRQNTDGPRIWFIEKDRRGAVWIGTDQGVARHNPTTGTTDHFPPDPKDPNAIGHNDALSFLQDRDGDIWIGVGNGLNRFRPDLGRFEHYSADPENNHDLGANPILFLFEDNAGRIWIASMGKGVSMLDKTQERFELLRHIPGNTNSPGHSSIFAVLKDHTGILWMGSHGGGLDRHDPITGRFTHYRRQEDNPNSLSNDEIWSLAEDHQNRLWIGTSEGLNLKQDDGFKIYRGKTNTPGQLSGSYIVDLHVDRDGRLWIACYANELNRYLPQSDSFQHYGRDPQNPDSLPSREIWAIEDTPDGNLWLATSSGLVHFIDQDQAPPKITTYQNNPTDSTSLSANRVLALKLASDNTLWIGTVNGFARLNPDQTFTTRREAQGLANNFVYCILEDKDHNLWLSTNRGLSQYNPRTDSFRNYDVFDGLQGSEFNLAAGYSDEFGKLYFGGVNGLNAFYPADLKKSAHTPPVVITQLLIQNQHAPLKRRDPKSPLTQTIEHTQAIELGYNRANIALEFAALAYSQPEKNHYAYQLEGVDSQWNHTTADRRFVTYGHLAPGAYRFRVKGADKDGVWNDTGATLQIRILPPWWRTLPAYLLYLLLMVLGILVFLRRQQRILEHERAVNERLMQVDKLRDEFLANTSHELNTPLNGIIGLAESLLNGIAGALPEKAHDNLSMIVSSGRRLTSLVNDILDFSSLKNDSITLRRSYVDPYQLVDEILNLSQPLIGAKAITLTNAVPQDTPAIMGDVNRLQQIMHNLVGNAVKFTEQGSVTVSAQVAGDRLQLSVADTGIGIPADKIDLIFQSFKQADASTARTYGGSGLGLAITKQLVLLHGGDIRVHSKLGQGSTFTVSLPLDKGMPETPTPQDVPQKKPAPATPNPDALPNAAGPEVFLWSSMTMPLLARGRIRILVVDDEPVNRRVVTDFLQPLAIDEAHDGPSAIDRILAAAESDSPYDLVLLDVMMPRMSGYDVCRILRQSFSLRELPIIFLTAKNQIQNIVRGFKLGANDYLTKPIEREELLSRIRTHLELRTLSRDLEHKVEDRTRELDQKLKELATHNRIMQTINREVSFTSVGRAMLEQAEVLFPNLDRGVFLCFNLTGKVFRVLAARGFEPNTVENATATLAQLESHFMAEMEVVKGDILLSNPQRGITAVPHTTAPACRVAVIIRYEQKIVGIMVLESTVNPNAFQATDLPRLSRFREHAISAVVKAKMLEDMVLAQKKLVEAAHTSGMAEIAAHVMHSVGNSLNSARISAELIREQTEDDKHLALFIKTVELLNNQTQNLAEFLAEDDRGQKIPMLLDKVARHLQRREAEIAEESERLLELMSSLSDVLREQEEFTHVEVLAERCNLHSVIQEVLEMERYLLKEAGVQIREVLEQTPEVILDIPKLRRVIQYLFKNAREALANQSDAQMTIALSATEDTAQITIQDNGPGISAQTQNRMFNRGFTTKAGHRGFGLHYCANALKEMNGSLKITSLGEGHGTQVQITLPRFPTQAQPPDQSS